MVKEESIELQKVQQPIIQEQKLEKIANIGRTQRPLNQRTQVNNVYLDSCVAEASQEIQVPSGQGEWTIVDGYEYTVVGNYNYSKGNTNKIIIPVKGTYIINIRIIINDLFGDLGLAKYEVLKNGNMLLSDGKLTMSYFESMNIIFTENFDRLDEIQLQINTDEETEIRTLDVKISITKIS